MGKALLAYAEHSPSSSLWSFLDPFDVATRAAIVAVFVVACVVYALSKKLTSSYRQSRNTDANGSCLLQSLVEGINSFWLFYTSAMQQGPERIPFVSGRIIVAGWFFFCLVIISTYTANLAAFLTTNSFITDINSLDDLASQTETQYGTVRDSSIVEFLKTSLHPVHQRMYRFINASDDALVDTADEAIRRVKYQTKGNFIFIWDEPILEYAASHPPCKSHVIGKRFNTQTYALAMPKQMPYAKNFSLAILKMRESGFLDLLAVKWLKSGVCGTSRLSTKDTDVKHLRITDLQGVFVILAFAVGLSVVVSVLERLRRSMRQERNPPDTKSEKTTVTLNTDVRKHSLVYLATLH